MDELQSRLALQATQYLDGATAPDSSASSGKKSKKKAKKEKKEKPKWNLPAAGSKKPKKVIEEIHFENTTPPGEMKDLSGEMESKYYPQAVEAAWDAWWEKQGYYGCDVEAASKAKFEDRFVMVIPPPNVTGYLHIGHALMLSIEDALCRWHRMNGKHVLWVPGVDHAGIATQSVVEKQLAKGGITKHDLGREGFLKKVWEWKEEKGNAIVNQFRKLGASLDYSRDVFTMDSARSTAVTEAFVRMFEKGLVFRNTRLVNWSHALNTAISDIEVDHEDVTGRVLRKVPGHKKKYEFGVITSFAYKVCDSDEEIVVATTRLETMMGDTAVCVHPDDERYKHLHGKFLQHPFLERKIPIVTDGLSAKMDKGTGAVKITPAHDPNDYKCGVRNNLPMISIFNDDGTMNEECGEFAGMMRYDARVAVEERLTEMNLFREKKDNPMSIPLCSRSGDVIEPRLKPQWFVDCKDMASRALDAVEKGDLKFLPATSADTYRAIWKEWLTDAHDWCVSRQLWWGHRIPAYLVKRAGEPDPDTNDDSNWVVGRSYEEALENASKIFKCPKDQLELSQDEDVLDTWFSSGLFPFSCFKWPNESLELDTFFPGHLLETGHDILFFWVARMVMMSLELCDKLPFQEVYLHAMVRDKRGDKMSKARGNVIDPLSVIHGCTLEDLNKTVINGNLPESEVKLALRTQKEDFPNGISKNGADALRFGLIAYTVQGRSVNLDLSRVEAYRKFGNKLWQVSRFLLTNLGATFSPEENFVANASTNKKLALRDRWMLSRLAETVRDVDKAMKKYSLGETTQYLTRFWLDFLCDVYVESIKPILKSDGEAKTMALNTLWVCLDAGLKLLHPFMPFVTEELWQHLPNKPSTETKSIMISKYPVPENFDHLADDTADAEFNDVLNVGRSARQVATLYKVNHKRQVIHLISSDEALKALVNREKLDVETIGNVTLESMPESKADVPAGCAMGVVNKDTEVYMYLKGVVDKAAEIKRLNKLIKKVEQDALKLQKSMSAPLYQDKTPEDVQQIHKDRAIEFEGKKATLLEEITKFEQF